MRSSNIRSTRQKNFCGFMFFCWSAWSETPKSNFLVNLDQWMRNSIQSTEEHFPNFQKNYDYKAEPFLRIKELMNILASHTRRQSVKSRKEWCIYISFFSKINRFNRAKKFDDYRFLSEKICAFFHCFRYQSTDLNDVWYLTGTQKKEKGISLNSRRFSTPRETFIRVPHMIRNLQIVSYIARNSKKV